MNLTQLSNSLNVSIIPIKSLDEALEQIKEKEYYKPFLGKGKSIFLVGVNIDTAKSEAEWKVEEFKD